LVEKWWPSPEQTEQSIKDDPRIWLRVYAANLSYHNPFYLDARLQGTHVSLETLGKKIDEAED